jgi:HlyD family secretion protein
MNQPMTDPRGMPAPAAQAQPVQTGEDVARTLAAAGRGRGWRRLFWVLVVVGLAAAGWFYSQQGAAVAVTTYDTEEITRGTLTVTVTATGTVQPTTEVEISSELSGTLVEVAVDFNDPVTVGQVLARLDDTKLKAQVLNAEAALTAARARLVQAEATATETEANYLQQQELDARGVTARINIVAAKAAYDRAAAAVDIARADLRLAEANLTLQQVDSAKAEIRSPINGIVMNRTAEVGQTVASSLSAPVLFTLAEDLTRMELQVDIDEADIGKVAVGDQATFTVEAYQGRAFPAEITEVRFAPEATEGVVTYKAILSVENPDEALRPGMTATAAITVAEVADTLQVSNTALRYAPPQEAQSSGSSRPGLLGLIMPSRGGGGGAGTATGKSIWVLRGGVPVEVPVTLGETDGRMTAIVSDDLAAGDLAITDQSTAE